MNPSTKETIKKYWGILALLLWGGLILLLGLLRSQPYGIDESAARGLLLNWTVADNVINPIVVFGVPDFRALLYVPIGMYWPGNLLAAKILGLLIAFAAATMLFRWARANGNEDSALIAAVLFLISPAVLGQLDSLGAGPYILLGLAIGAWLDHAYRAKPRYFGGWYFSQMLWIAILITIHPLAIAYPLALAWHWYRNPDEHKKPLHVYIGILVAVLLAISLKTGWEDMNWLSNPIQALATSLDGGVIWSIEDIEWIPGIIAALLAVTVIILDFRFLSKNLLGLFLLSASILGLLAADEAWATVVLGLLLFRGVYLAASLNQRLGKQTFVGQWGLVAVIGFVFATYSMMEAKTHRLVIMAEMLNPQDEVIRELADVAADESKPFRAASEWPGRTMLAARRDVLPLPPAIDDDETFRKSLQSVTHLIFNPYSERNKALADKLSHLTGETETLAYMKGGVIIEVLDHSVELQHYRPPVSTKTNDTNPIESAKDATDTAD